jgi:hypothetical protein
MITAVEVQDLREQIARLKLMEAKYRFLLGTMPKMCVHYDHALTQLPDGRVDVILTICSIHTLEKSMEIRHVRVDIDSFEEQLAVYMRRSGQ